MALLEERPERLPERLTVRRLVQRIAPLAGTDHVGTRLVRAALIEGDDVARLTEPLEQVEAVPGRGPAAGAARPARQVHDRGARVVARTGEADEVNLQRIRSGIAVAQRHAQPPLLRLHPVERLDLPLLKQNRRDRERPGHFRRTQLLDDVAVHRRPAARRGDEQDRKAFQRAHCHGDLFRSSRAGRSIRRGRGDSLG